MRRNFKGLRENWPDISSVSVVPCQQSPEHNCRAPANIDDDLLAESNCTPGATWPDGCRNNPDPDDPGPFADPESRYDLYHRLGLHYHDVIQDVTVAPDVTPTRLDYNRYAEDTSSGVGRTWRYQQDFKWKRWVIKRKTAKDRLSRALRRIWLWCRNHRHEPMRDQQHKLAAMMRGHYAYFGITANSEALRRFARQVERAWWTWLTRRSQHGRFSWAHMKVLLARFALPRPRIVHCYT